MRAKKPRRTSTTPARPRISRRCPRSTTSARNGYRRFFLVGSDYIYPRTTNAVIKGYLAAHGIAGGDVAERYAPAGFAGWKTLVEDIRRFAKGERAAIVATVSGDANLHFFRELARQGVGADTIPVMSLSINEAELPALMRSNIAGHLVAWNYLHAFDSEREPRLHRRLAPLQRPAERR